VSAPNTVQQLPRELREHCLSVSRVYHYFTTNQSYQNMRKLGVFLFAALFVSACQPSKSENESQGDTTTTTASTEASPNQLTDREKADGWKLLFNGQNMDGWRTYQNKENDSWEVTDGALHCKPEGEAEQRADILTVDQYGDFELAFDWKIAPTDNSGVIYRATEEFEQPYLSGPEYQVIDDKGYPDKLSPTQTSGSNYDMHAAPDNKPINPPGEWNTARIIAKGNHVEHWLNGTKVVEYEINSADWKKLKDGSKWKDAKGYGASSKGHIDLQDHGGEVWYRNIRVKTL